MMAQQNILATIPCVLRWTYKKENGNELLIGLQFNKDIDVRNIKEVFDDENYFYIFIGYERED